MSGAVCLQGGAEFGDRCVEMDRAVLELAPPGSVVVLAGAAAPGREHDIATANALRHYRRLGSRPVFGAPDPRRDLDACLEAIREAALVVLPGGSPRRLLDVMALGVGDALRSSHEHGAALSGASAGAMVLCEHTAIPGDGVRAGLGLVEGVVVPHFDGGWWDLALGPEVTRWGLPECGGVVFSAGTVSPVGSGTVQVLRDGVANALA